jgi:hypothetical protein
MDSLKRLEQVQLRLGPLFVDDSQSVGFHKISNLTEKSFMIFPPWT